jgi:predicted Zn-dependent protease
MKRFSSVVAISLLFTACAISTQQEVEIGAQYSQQINAQLPIVRDPEVNRYINVLGDSLAHVADARGLSWRFFIVDSKEVNAFAVPGGYVYVNRGLIERASRMNMLAGVLGHEIGHVTRRHSVKQMQAAQRANAGLTLTCILTRICESQAAGAAIQIGGSALFAKFSRDDERQADEEGVATLVRAGIDPRGIPTMFRVLLDERKRSPGGVDAWFSTHPLEEDRIQETEAQIARYNTATIRSLTVDTPGYQSFRQRLLSLPVTARR